MTNSTESGVGNLANPDTTNYHQPQLTSSVRGLFVLVSARLLLVYMRCLLMRSDQGCMFPFMTKQAFVNKSRWFCEFVHMIFLTGMCKPGSQQCWYD